MCEKTAKFLSAILKLRNWFRVPKARIMRMHLAILWNSCAVMTTRHTYPCWWWERESPLSRLRSEGNPSDKSELKKTRQRRQHCHKFVYLAKKNNSLHALQVHFSSLYISLPFLSFPQCEMTFSSYMEDVNTWWLIFIFSSYRNTADTNLFPR